MDRRRCCTYQEAMIVADVLVMSGFTSTACHSTSTVTEGQNLLLPCTAVCVTSCEYTEPTLRHIIHAVERCNRTILSLPRTVISEQQNDFDDHLPATLCAYRSTPHASTGISPHKMVYGIESDPSPGPNAGRHWTRAGCQGMAIRVCGVDQ